MKKNYEGYIESEQFGQSGNLKWPEMTGRFTGVCLQLL